MAKRLALEQHRAKAHTVERVLLGCLGAGQVEHRRHEIQRDDHLVAHLSRLDPARPPGDAWHAVTALPHRPLFAAEREPVTLRATHVGMAVVGAENHERIFLELQLDQLVEHLADALIHRGHHLHVGFLDRGFLFAAILFRTALDWAAGPLKRRVHRLVRHVQAERLGLVFVDEPECMPGDQMRRVALLLDRFQAVPPVVHLHPVVVRQIVDVATDKPAKIRETVVHRVELFFVAKMPLAKDGRGVVSLGQQFREGVFTRPQAAVVIRHLRVGVDDRRHAGAFLVTAGQQPGAGRAAHHATRVVVGEAHSLAGHAVQVRRLEPATVGAGRIVAHVVRHDDDKVRLGGID